LALTSGEVFGIFAALLMECDVLGVDMRGVD
jgi:hypothetical protein